MPNRAAIHTRLPKSWRRVREDHRRSRRAALRMRAAARRRTSRAQPIDPVESAKIAGLRYVSDERMRGIRRIGRQNRFRYVGLDGRTIADRAELQRIKALAIPPAWTDVWICPSAAGHLQATGRDARRRKQYRYHPRWREVRDEVKYGRLVAFARALPRIRARTDADLKRAGLPREKVLAAVVQLLEKTLIRVGNEEYARQNRSFGLTTMREQHATIDGSTMRFVFRGKSGIEHSVDLRDARLARIVKACRDLPGYELFGYVDGHRERQVIDSADVNAYVREISGEDFTAKDFRTWAGTVLAAKALAGVRAFASQAEAKRNIVRAIESVAKRLGNTQAVCRKCYIHPAVFDAYLDGATIDTARTRGDRLTKKTRVLTDEEAAVVGLIEQRLRKIA
jgi:DNA topoisomerase-1